MKEAYLLGVDIGTSSVKAAVIDTNGSILGISGSSYKMKRPKPGYVQIDVKSMWEALIKCLRLLKEGKGINPGQISGISISSLCPGLVGMGADGEVLVEPIIYSDSRSVEEAKHIRQVVGEEQFFAITANNVMAGGISATSMLWVKRHLPKVYENICYFGHVNTLLAYKMTGNYAIDYSNASYTGLFETAGGYQWSPLLCSLIGIDINKLPPLMPSSGQIGGLIEQELISLGLKRGTPVIIGGGDTACAALAAGVTSAGDVCESAGTTNVLTVCVEEPKFDRAFINRCHVVDGCWIYQGALSHTGASYQWFRDEFYKELDCKHLKDKDEITKQRIFSMMNKEAAEAEPGARGIVFLPYMGGERSPVWDPCARGIFFGMTLEAGRKEMNRAIMEGCAYGLRQLCERAEEVTGWSVQRFYSMGGGAKSEVWTQIKADIMGKDIIILDMNDMAPVGAALLAGVGTGLFSDMYEAGKKIPKKIYRTVHSTNLDREAYERGYRIYTGLYTRIKELYRY